MGILDSLSISASALTAERTRMDVTAENLANAQTTRTEAGVAGAQGALQRAVEVDVLALVAGDVRVREVLRGDVHAQALGGEARARGVDRVEEAHG